ncbi:biotin transporter BioY [Ancylobacter sp. 6x-1]|uniref:Biotin transporter n=1 Tax=Ancylobacter crimeensis TaxID=2579147 RepID=A0ABT0DFH1_9HYPH|nr:biotin transporter BioY [Ancylobacter crimeensis]MCK0198697.1 biotin transporter BioY [Ancylobacter crimeensis]
MNAITRERSLVQIALYAAIIAAMGLMPKFELPFGVPITSQSMGIMLAGVMLGAWRGAAAVALFLLAVALGAPLLAGGRGGIGVFFGPSAGFLLCYPLSAFVAGLLMQGLRSRAVLPSAFLAAVVGGILVLYPFGIAGLSLLGGLSLADAAKACLIFIPGDTVKAVLVALIAQTVARGLPEALLSRA